MLHISLFYADFTRVCCVSLTDLNRASIAKRTITFEMKKILLDKLEKTTGIHDLDKFIEIYNEQERAKADFLETIEAKRTQSKSHIPVASSAMLSSSFFC